MRAFLALIQFHTANKLKFRKMPTINLLHLQIIDLAIAKPIIFLLIFFTVSLFFFSDFVEMRDQNDEGRGDRGNLMSEKL